MPTGKTILITRVRWGIYRGEVEGMLLHADANGDGHIEIERVDKGGDRGDVVTR